MEKCTTLVVRARREIWYSKLESVKLGADLPKTHYRCNNLDMGPQPRMCVTRDNLTECYTWQGRDKNLLRV